ncbi:hypothetical protein HMI56_006761 [Coelomomyces lativittatus]|nr:hypothetical protein HMI56_006761 [Coelomomyces lativittatus]
MIQLTSKTENPVETLNSLQVQSLHDDERTMEILETYQEFLCTLKATEMKSKLAFVHLSRAKNDMNHRIDPIYFDFRMKSTVLVNEQHELEHLSPEFKDPTTWFGQPVSSHLITSQRYFKDASNARVSSCNTCG